MSSYGLKLLGDNPTDVALRHVASNFPGALPYVLFRGGDRIGYFESQEAVSVRVCGRPGEARWERDRSVTGFVRWTSPEYELQYGREDWSEESVVLVGEMNPYQGYSDFDLYDLPERASGHRLRALVLGVRRETYFRRFARHNLCAVKWSAPAARKRALELAELYPTEAFVLLGRKVQETFFQHGDTFDVYEEPGGRRVVLLPHPSGLCRTWGEPGAFARARKALRAACPGLPLGEVDRAG